MSSIPLYFVLSIMKHRIALFFLLFSFVSIVGETSLSVCYGQSLNLLTGLHPRPQVSYFLNPQDTFWLNTKTVILCRQSTPEGELRAIGYLNRRIKEMFGDTLTVERVSDDSIQIWPYFNFIIVGDTRTFRSCISYDDKIE